MKKIIFAIFLMSALTGFAKTPTKPTVTLTKNAAGEWEFVIHNQTKHYIDEFWVSAVDATHGGSTVWHKGHFVGDGDHFIAPGQTMHLTLHDAHEAEYFLYTHDTHDHHGYLYKLHLDHDVDVDDEEEDADEFDDVFGTEHHEGDEIDLDEHDDEDGH